MQIERIAHSSAMPAISGPKKNEALEEIVITEDPVAPAEENEDNAGVLRLLQEGHFKGVADVRLRINFYEELQSIESQARLDAASGGFAAFNQSLETDINALKESGELTEEQTAALDAFLSQLQTVQNGYDGATPFAEIISRLQEQFDTLLGSLNPSAPEAAEELENPQELPLDEQTAALEESLEQPAVEESFTQESLTEEPPQAQGNLLPETTEEPNVFQQLVANLQNTFQQAIEQLQSAVTTPGILPPLSEPSGNGKAYAKFVAIYEAMQNGTAAPEEPDAQIEEPVAEA